MRKVQVVAVLMALSVMAAGCAVNKREWGTCTLGGAALGAAAGGLAGGVAVNNVSDANDSKRGGAIAGGLVGGALLGGLLGHLVCDPLKDPVVVQAEAPPPPPPAGTEIAELRGAHFAFDSDQLSAEGEAALDGVVTTMQEHEGMHVRCEGHTDSVGSDTYNLQLGQRRADTVRDYLVGRGIAADRVSTQSFGETDPAADNDTEEGRALNRRVEIVVE